MGAPIEELGGRTWEELEVLEHEAGQLMFPAKLRRRDKSGAVVTTAVRVRAPSAADQFAARKEARAWCRKAELDEQKDKELFEQLEQLCLLAKAVRTDAAPHGQFADAADLANYDEGCLRDLQEQVTAFKARLDPRESILTDEQAWKAIVAVAREANIGPLVDIDGHEQPILVVRMALEACRSPNGQRWLQSFGISIPALSAPTSSAPS
jgi:hypothetical protein